MKRSRGFTMLEVIVSVGVTGMIAIAIWASTSQTARAREIVEYSQDSFHQVRVAFDMLNRDLSSTFLSLHRGGNPSHDTVFYGASGSRNDEVHFAAFSHNRRYFNAKESDQNEISYYVAEDVDEPGVFNLVRRSSPILNRDPLTGGQHLVILNDIVEFNLEYYNIISKDWQSEWDTTQASGETTLLPTLVRVKLVVNERVGQDRLNRRDNIYQPVTYGTMIPIPMRSAIHIGPWFTPGLPIGIR